MDKKSNENKVFKMFSRKAKEYTENTAIKVNIDIFYELFRLAIFLYNYAIILSIFWFLSKNS
jgi:hypothetical protein